MRLDSVPNILRELGRVYRAARARSIPVGEASQLAFILSTMARLHVDESFERRLVVLEQQEQTSA